MENYYNILLPVATQGVYTYKTSVNVKPGSRVIVPIGKREAFGIVLEKTVKPEFECREISGFPDDAPLFSKTWLEFLMSLSVYYVTQPGLTLHGVLSRKLLESFPKDRLKVEYAQAEEIVLSPEQMDISAGIDINKYEAHLLNGITGSGKTEVYLWLAKKVIAMGRKVIYLVPEISLTHQLMERISARLGFAPLMFHSRLTPKKRNEAFWNFALYDAPFIIGPRSALFIPVKNPGLIIIDEEHESTYKQEEAPAYNLRDMGVLYAKLHNIPVILGSATPQVESYANALSGKYKSHLLTSRAGPASLPDIHIVDAKKQTLFGGIIAEPVYNELAKTVSRGKQGILFLNRKGYATSLYCNSCGTLQECRNCSVPVTMNKDGSCVCYYCAEKYYHLKCSECGSADIRDVGAGTQRIEEFVEEMFPGETIRLDADTAGSMKKLSAALNDFQDKKASILVGTQIIAKGLHFPDVTFVGILGIDNILAMPDFRATEKAYQLIMQVSGRAGRGEHKGDVYIQTNLPDTPLFELVKQPQYAYYEYELEKRKALMYPPYSKLSRLIFSGVDGHKAELASRKVYEGLNTKFKDRIQLLGPAQAVVYKIKNIYRYSILIKTHTGKDMASVLGAASAIHSQGALHSVQMKIDRDPYFFM